MTAVPVCVCDDHFMEFAKEPAGRVHSVYEKAVNIWDGRHLFAIVSGRDFAAPYTANVEGLRQGWRNVSQCALFREVCCKL